MEYHQIRYVLAVAETRNFSQAADREYVTQPTLSQQIMKLEDELGVKLFHRTTRSVQLTAAGEAFVASAVIIREEWKRLKETAEYYQNQKIENITIGLLPTLGRTDIARSLHDYIVHYPNAKIRLITNYSYSLIQKLHSGEIDIGIINILPFITKNSESIDTYPLEKNIITVIMNKNHPLAKRESVTLEEIRELPVLVLNKTASVRLCMDWIFQKNKIKPHIICECEIDNLVDLVAADMGISFLTTRVADSHPAIAVVPLHPPVTIYTSVVTKKSRKNKPIIEEVRNYIIAAYQNRV
jgi:LysR family hydrogen peroxide-inducible transcriptional activator